MASVTRVVSLVPSLTEAVAATAPGLLVGATDWCTHPAGLDVTRVGGTKNPDVPAIVALRPDLVLVAVEENRRADAEALRAAGVEVHVTDIRALDGPHGAFEELARMLTACGLGRPGWLAQAERAWRVVPVASPRRRALTPIWRRPWMAIGSDTFTGALLARLGFDGVLADSPERYPRFGLDDVTRLAPDLVVLPDEPYAFGPDDGPECFAPIPSSCVSGRLLTWYGPSLLEAAEVLPQALTLP